MKTRNPPHLKKLVYEDRTRSSSRKIRHEARRTVYMVASNESPDLLHEVHCFQCTHTSKNTKPLSLILKSANYHHYLKQMKN